MDTNATKDTKQALEWIVGVLQKHRVPFQISGGCAAKIYGSPRELNDIDIDIPEDCFEKVMADVRPFIIYGPAQYKDQKWDLYLMTLNYARQEIDIGGQHAKISTRDRAKWVDFNFDSSKAVKKEFLGLEVPVIPKKDLIAYKQLLDGDHQQIDIESIK
ncbi:MAG: MazG-related protein [bacterium]|nr:MazG-related protein [bacterium]